MRQEASRTRLSNSSSCSAVLVLSAFLKHRDVPGWTLLVGRYGMLESKRSTISRLGEGFTWTTRSARSRYDSILTRSSRQFGRQTGFVCRQG